MVWEADCIGGTIPLPSRTDPQLPSSSIILGPTMNGGGRQDSMTALACKELLFCYISTLFAPSKLVRYLFYSGGYSMSLHWHALATFLHSCFHPSCTVWGKTWHCLPDLPNLVLVMSLGDGGSSSPPTHSLDTVFYWAQYGFKKTTILILQLL